MVHKSARELYNILIYYPSNPMLHKKAYTYNWNEIERTLSLEPN
jgi:hypothetical protein